MLADLQPVVLPGPIDSLLQPLSTGSTIAFDGFLALYHEDEDDPIDAEDGSRLPPLEETQKLARGAVEPLQHFTQPPPRYTEASLVKQYQALLATEGVKLELGHDGIRRLAQIAFDVNERTENIGARRLSTVMERLLDEISFDAPKLEGQTVSIGAAEVDKKLGELAKNEDLSRYIL